MSNGAKFMCSGCGADKATMVEKCPKCGSYAATSLIVPARRGDTAVASALAEFEKRQARRG